MTQRLKNKVYLAARYSRREELCEHRSILESADWFVTSRWLNGNHQVTDDGLSAEGTREPRTRFAQEDYEDVCASDILISFTEPPRSTSSRGGRHVEFGLALGLGIRCIVVGPRENVFHCLPRVEVYDSFGDALQRMEIYCSADPFETLRMAAVGLVRAVEGLLGDSGKDKPKR